MNLRAELGRNGEDLAAAHFERLGYTIIQRNFRCSAGEVDIVAERDGTIVFCEVKTRRTDRWGQPSEAVDHRKRARIRRLGATWLAENGPRRSGSVRFDVISLVVRGGESHLEHIEDAF